MASASPAWRARARQAGLAEAIHFLGFHPRVREVLAGCDLLVAPVRYEAYGLAIQEAACLGVAPLVSAAAGVAERFPAGLQPLLLRDPEDADELAARLRAWHGERPRYHALALELSARLRAWSWAQMAGRIVDIMEAAG
jgi:glycosyltransferase involved in cell wall biosynthesis